MNVSTRHYKGSMIEYQGILNYEVFIDRIGVENDQLMEEEEQHSALIFENPE